MRFILCLVLFFAALPLVAQDATTSTVETDAATAIQIRSILEELGTFEDVTVTVSSGIVTLRGETKQAADITELEDIMSRVDGIVSVKNKVTETTDIVERLDPAVERLQARVKQFVTFLPLALIAACVFALIVLFGFFIARRRQPWERIAPNAFIAEIFRQLTRLVFIIGGIVVALDILNATALLSTILGAAGIIGLALGFAVRDTVENFIASVMLSIRQPFSPNDTVEINGDIGNVIRLTSRATILLSFDGNQIRIPNATVFKSRIINYSRNTERRFKFSVNVPIKDGITETKTLVAQTVQSLPFVLSAPETLVWIESISDGHAALEVTSWIDQHETSFVSARGEAQRQVRLALSRSLAPKTPAARAAAQKENEQSTVQTVAPTENAALERIIEAERETSENEDLLRDDAMKE
jgi:small-conductance mechanosensitive channel